MSLPSFREFAVVAVAGGFLGKREFRHGFHHLTVALPDRKWLGFDMPGQEGKVEGRFCTIPFGMS